MRAQITAIYNSEIESFHFSPAAQQDWSEVDSIPHRGTSAATVQALIENTHALDFDQRLNRSSYVNVSFEPEEEAVLSSALARTSQTGPCTLSLASSMSASSTC